MSDRAKFLKRRIKSLSRKKRIMEEAGFKPTKPTPRGGFTIRGLEAEILRDANELRKLRRR